MQNILYLINPKSQEGNARNLWEKACEKYENLPHDPLDVTQINVEKVIKEKEYDLIVIAGGDGTINSVCTIVAGMKKKPLLSIIPMGHGNAISYCLGVETLDKAFKVLQEQKHKLTIDIMKTTSTKHPLGLFNISVGYDARVVFNRQHHLFIGFKSYVLSALRSFVSHTEQEITLTIDKKVQIKALASSLVVANCPVIGQNYFVSPTAKFNDGLLDCTLFSSKYDYITNLRFRGFKHPLYNEMGKVRFKASHVKIEGEPYVQIDGDPVVKKEGIEITIIPNQLTFLRNSEDQINQTIIPFVTK